MNVLPIHFHTFRIFGLWYEEPRRLRPLKLFHQCLAVFLTLHFTVLQLVTLVLMRDAGIEVITACLFISLTYVAASYKLLYFIADRPSLEDLLDKFRLDVCQPQNPEELAIAHRHHTVVSRLFVVRMVTTLMSGFGILLQSFVGGKEKQLPINAYEMFDTSGDVGFAVGYAAQFITVVCAIAVDVCLDATACAFIILIGCQLELLSQRIATTGGRNFKSYVYHHNLIFDITKKVQAFFLNVILPAFFFGLITLCSSIHQLVQAKGALADFIGVLIYLGVMMIQIYYYCWCGNELEFKMLKTSYGAYNLLQQISSDT